MFGIGVNLQFLRHCFAQLVFRQHAFYRLLDYPLRVSLKHLGDGDLAEATWIPRVMPVNFLLGLRTLEHYFTGIDHDDVIAHVHERCPSRTAFTRQNARNLRGKMSDCPPGRINDVPLSTPSEFLPAGEVC